MENLQARAIEAAEKYLAHKGYEVVETDPEGGADVIARGEGALVFVDVAAREGADKGMPGENLPAARERMEAAAAKWLAAHADDEDIADVRVRFDTIGMMVLSESKALLRHHINCLGADFAG